jgi:protein involved in sex pheromone biosynthesis
MKNIINDVNQYSSNESKDTISNWDNIKNKILGNEEPEETKTDNFRTLMDNVNKYIPYYQSKVR